MQKKMLDFLCLLLYAYVCVLLRCFLAAGVAFAACFGACRVVVCVLPGLLCVWPPLLFRVACGAVFVFRVLLVCSALLSLRPGPRRYDLFSKLLLGSVH